MPPEADPAILSAIFTAISAHRGKRPVVLGLCGAQGSGKSTLANAIVREAGAAGVIAAALSLDDLYLTRGERAALARDVHPLLRTRGVPGTHDVLLGLDVFAAIDRGEAAALPRFDKARDDRMPRAEWGTAPAGCGLLVFEGWCVGARPQAEAALAVPVNALEAQEDADGRWRRYANAALSGHYEPLFARTDIQILLAAPDFSAVFGWRMQQEEALRRRAPGARGVMDAVGVARFIHHYERLTRHILAEMPPRADIVVRLDAARRPLAITRRGST